MEQLPKASSLFKIKDGVMQGINKVVSINGIITLGLGMNVSPNMTVSCP
jgi:hypothetical protein